MIIKTQKETNVWHLHVYYTDEKIIMNGITVKNSKCLNDEYHKSDPKIFIMGICIGKCEAIHLCQQNQNKLPIEPGVEPTHYVET